MRFLPPDLRVHLRLSRFRGRVAGLTVAATALLSLTGCHVLGGSTAAGPSVSATLNVSAVAGVEDAPLYIGIHDNLFKQAGLTIRLHNYPSVKTEVDHLRNGTSDLALVDYADAFYANEQKPAPNLSLVADGYDCGPNVMEVLTLPGSKITSVQGLAGKRIGTAKSQDIPASNSQPYSMETVAAWSALSNDNVSPGGITWEQFDPNDLVSAVQSGEVDAILATEPTITNAETQQGLVPVLDACSGPTENLPLDGYFSTQAYAKKHAAVIAAFRSALAKAQTDAGISAPVQTALENYAGMDKQTAALVTIGTYPTALSAENVQRVANIMFFYSALRQPVTVSQLVASQAH